MIEPLFTRSLTAEEVQRRAVLVPPELAERVRARVEAHPKPHCARVEYEARTVRVVHDGEGWWLENAVPHGATEGDTVLVHEGAETYCLAVALRRG